MVLTVDIARLSVYETIWVFQNGLTTLKNIPLTLDRLEYMVRPVKKIPNFSNIQRSRRGAEITRIEDLADPNGKDAFVSDPEVTFRISSMASIMRIMGPKRQKNGPRTVANLARKPQGNDRAQVKGFMKAYATSR